MLVIDYGWWGPDVSGTHLEACRAELPHGPYIVPEREADGAPSLFAFSADTTWAQYGSDGAASIHWISESAGRF